MTKKIRVLVVDDSALMRKIIPSLLEEASDIEVVGVAADPMIARQKIKQLDPDVVTLDVEMPKMDGLSFLEKIMSLRPMPVLMISSLTQKGADITLQALELGAVDVVGKPALDVAANMESLGAEIINKVRVAAKSNVTRRANSGQKVRPLKVEGFSTTEKIVAIGASTGGVETLGRILEGCPANMPGMVITQHMPANFTAKFAERLDRSCAMKIREAVDGERIRPGDVWIAPGDAHLEVKRSGADYVCKVYHGEPVSGHCPSVDVLFKSVAKACGKNAVGVILTGMGKDGADGLLEMRNAGAKTIGQDEATSIVYGMPKAAYDIGAVEKQLPEDKILGSIINLVSQQSKAIRI